MKDTKGAKKIDEKTQRRPLSISGFRVC